MTKLEDIKPGILVEGITSDGKVSIINIEWHGNDLTTITYKDASGSLNQEIVGRENENKLKLSKPGISWSFKADPNQFKLVSEAQRISLAYLFDPLLAVHTSKITPLPHQITAVYDNMLHRQPLKFLLADDPGAGKTIMAGLLIKELIVRGDVKRCLIVSPGGLVEQWQEELFDKFQLEFDVISRDRINNARTGNPFTEMDMVIARLDQLSRNEDLQLKVCAEDWDLIVVDEAHKMAAHFYTPNKLDKNGKANHAFQQALEEIGIKFVPSRARHPQTNGKLEKFHHILDTGFDERFEDIDQFINHYNDERMSEAVDYMTPNEAYKKRL